MSSGNKKVLLLILAIGILVGTYLYVYSPTQDDNESLNSEITKLEKKYKDLKAKDADREIYISGIETFNKQFDDILSNFPGDLNQEVSVMFMKGLDNQTDFIDDFFDINSVGLGQVSEFYTLGGNAGGYVCNTASFPISYEGSYDGIQNIMEYIMNYKYRMNISSVSIAYDAETETCTGSILLNAYSVVGEDRDGDTVDIDIPHEVSNLFIGGSGAPAQAKTYEYDSDEGASIESDYDIIMMLNNSANDSASGIILADSSNGEASYVTDDSNSVVDVDVTVYDKDDKNYVIYAIGDSSFEFELTSEDLTIFVNSSERVDSEDSNGVKVSITNDTDVPVFFKVKNDDATSPRFKLANKMGVVKVY